MRPRLTVISDTPMQRRGGRIFALEVVVRELMALRPHVGQIVWHGFAERSAGDALVEVPAGIECHLWPAVGGASVYAKLRAAASLPHFMAVAHRALSTPGVVHVRGPSLPALCVALRARAGSVSRVWFKYAGAWQHPQLPLSYRLYRALIRAQRHALVTMNGEAPDGEPHVVSLENPCLTARDRQQGAQLLQRKRFDGPLTLCVVGRVERAKGMDRVLAAVTRCPVPVARVLVVGRVAEPEWITLAKASPVPFEFVGALNREQLNGVYADAQLLLLPSRSEGFPKVVAEAWNYGCVPVTSDVGALATEVGAAEGHVWREARHGAFEEWFARLDLSPPALRRMAYAGHERAGDFTYDRYVSRLLPLLALAPHAPSAVAVS